MRAILVQTFGGCACVNDRYRDLNSLIVQGGSGARTRWWAVPPGSVDSEGVIKLAPFCTSDSLSFPQLPRTSSLRTPSLAHDLPYPLEEIGLPACCLNTCSVRGAPR